MFSYLQLALEYILRYSTTARSFFFWSQFCVLVDNFWLECRMTLIFSSAYSPTLKHDCRYPHHGLKMSRKFSRAVWISKTPPKTHSCLNFFQSNLPSNRLWGGMKSKKVPSAHVWGYIIALKYPKLTPTVHFCVYVWSQRSFPIHVWCRQLTRKVFSRPTKTQWKISKTQFLSSSKSLLL